MVDTSLDAHLATGLESMPLSEIIEGVNGIGNGSRAPNSLILSTTFYPCNAKFSRLVSLLFGKRTLLLRWCNRFRLVSYLVSLYCYRRNCIAGMLDTYVTKPHSVWLVTSKMLT